MECDLSWLFGIDQGPRTIRLIDTDPECRRQLEAFAAGAVYSEGSLVFQRYRDDELETYSDLTAKIFAGGCPAYKAIKITEAEFKNHILKELVEQPNYLPYSLSIKIDGELAGCVTSYRQTDEPHSPRYLTPESEHIWTTKLNCIESILAAVHPFSYCYPDKDGRLPPNSVDIRKVLHIACVGVSPDHGGKNYCYKLMLLSASLGYLDDLTLAIAECTNPRTSNFYKIGGFSHSPVLYKDFEYLGEKPFLDAEEDGVRFAFIAI